MRSLLTKRRLVVGGLALASLALRVCYVRFGTWDQELTGDTYFFHWEPWMLEHGLGFSDPYIYFHALQGRTIPSYFYATSHHKLQPTAHHPPALVILFFLADLVGLSSVGWHLVVLSALGAATVPLVYLVARQVWGVPGCYAAAFLAAFYPGMWIYDGQELAEQLGQTAIVATVLATYYGLRNRRRWPLFVGAVAGGVAGLARGEESLMVLVPALAPVMWSDIRFRQRVGTGLMVLMVGVAVMAPWLVRNMVTFRYPVTFATDLGAAVAAANCDPVYYGPNTGYENWGCTTFAHETTWTDESVYDKENLQRGVRYAMDHPGRAVLVAAARVGRVFYVYAPYHQATAINSGLDGWPLGATYAYWWSSYPVVALAVVGLRRARRQGVPLLPLLFPLAIGVLAVAITYGDIRFISSAEVAIVLLAAGGFEAAAGGFVALARRLAGSAGRSSAEGPGSEGANGGGDPSSDSTEALNRQELRARSSQIPLID